MERTIVIQLKPTPEQAHILKATLEQHTACFNAVAQEGFISACSNGVELHKRTYYPLRAQYPKLPAQLVCAARVKATEAVKSALTWKAKKEQAYPRRVEIPSPSIPSTDEVIGIDLGLNHPAVTSNRQFLGEKRWKEQERRTFRLRRKLQAKGSRSAKRHLKKLSGKQFRRRKDHDHVLSKRIVQHATPGSTIVLENLKHIRDTSKLGRGKKDSKKRDSKRRLHSWSFAQLYSFIEYKAQARGIAVVKI